MAGESQEIPNTGVPDPSVLTTEQLLREVENAVRLLETKIEGVADKFAAEVAGAQQFCVERFASIETQLALIERQRVEQKADTKAAVDAALAAAKEAVKEQTAASEKAINKSEEITKTQLVQLGDTNAASLKGLTDSLGDLKERVGKIEARRLGADETTTTKRLDAGLIVGALSVVVAVIAVAAAIIIGTR